VSAFTDEGSKWCSYLDRKATDKTDAKKQENPFNKMKFGIEV
jgi:hypothetical protein